MSTHLWALVVLMGVCFLATFASAAGAVYHVGVNGRDGWSGRVAQPSGDGRDGPLATLEGARDAIRVARKAGTLPAGGVEVLVHAGTYYREHSFEMDKQDSGTAEAPITYRAAPGETVWLVGGRRIEGFAPVADPAIVSRLSEAARGHVLVADLARAGITDYGQMHSRGFSRPVAPAGLELFFNGEPMTMARWPNEGYVKIKDFPKEAKGADDFGEAMGKLEGGFSIAEDRVSHWREPAEAWVHGFWAYDWANSYEQIASYDAASHLIKTRKPYGIYGFRPGQRVYFLNVLEELDSPGEWYLDRSKGLLYFWPPADIASAQVLASVMSKPMVLMRDVSNVTLRGLNIEAVRGNAVEIKGGTRDVVASCTLRNIGDYAVTVEGGEANGVAGCDIYNTGDGGISLSGGDRKTLAPGNHFANNNHIHHFSRWSRCYCPGVAVNGVGNRVSHNLLHDAPHCAILLSGNEHIIEFNDIHHVCMDTGDVGAFYMGRDYSQRGVVVRHNYFHEIGGMGMGSMAVYLDDNTSGITVLGNVFYRTQRAAFIGGGRDNRIKNNVFVECQPAVNIDARGLDKSRVWHDQVYKEMKPRLEAMKPHEPPYSTRYPELADLDKYYAKDDGVPPENNTVAHNICVGGKWINEDWGHAAHYLKLDGNLVDQDPRFTGPVKAGDKAPHAATDFALRADSPALKLGFKPIPVDQIGLMHDADRP